MPFDSNALVPLVATGGFTFWLYRTADTRAVALAAGYFSPAATRMATGDVMFLQASDALTLTTVRPANVVAPGLVVDTSAVPFRYRRASAQRFSVRQVASAVAMTVLLAPLAGSLVAGGTVQAQATVAGPVAQVAFSIRDSSGTTVQGPQAVPVTGGSASATLQAPAAGTGYRVRVEAVGNPNVAATSPSFAIRLPFALLTQGRDAIVAEAGGRVLI